MGNLTPAVNKNPYLMATKFGVGDDVSAKISLRSDKGFLLPALASIRARRRVQSDLTSFLGVLATTYREALIVMIYMLNDVFSHKDVLYERPANEISLFDNIFP